MMNLEWFRTFKAIYETGNLSTAAQSLFISQPGASLHLSSLETYTGYRLFERETRKMVPTERGIILYNCIIDAVNKLVEAEHQFFGKSKADKPMISVGMGLETFEHVLEEYITQLPFHLILRFGAYPQLLHDLNTGTLDLILVPEKGRHANLEYTPFITERMVLISSNATDTCQLDQLVMEKNNTQLMQWLKEQVWYTTAADMEQLKNFWQANFDCLPDFKPSYIVPNSSSILRCLRNGNGFAVMPDFLCKKEIQNNMVKLAWQGTTPVENTLYFGKRRKSVYANEIRQLEQLLKNNMDGNALAVAVQSVNA